MIESLVTALYAFVKVYLMVPSLLMDVLYKMGPVIAPMLAMAFCCVFPFIALRDKNDA
jgi:hypothetical protein